MVFYETHVKKNVNNFRFKTVNMSELRKAISSLNKSNSEDYYGLSMRMLMNIRKSIEPIILNLINLCIYNSIYPNSLKISEIIPIPKDKNFLNPSN